MILIYEIGECILQFLIYTQPAQIFKTTLIKNKICYIK